MASEGVFQSQIKSLMYVFGDVRHPHADSAQLVEEFTKLQLRDIVSQAARVSAMRDGRLVRIEDLLFLLRKDKDQLRRVIHHLEVKALTKRVRSTESRTDDGDQLLEETEVGEMSSSHHSLKKIKLLHDFLTPLQRAELRVKERDVLQTQRLEQQDELTNTMSTKEYMEYAECRGTTLYKDMNKFKEWIGVDELTSLRINSDVFDLIGHLAHETIRKLVELSLQVKSDMESRSHALRQWPATPSTFGHGPTLTVTPATQASSSDSAGTSAFVLGTPPSSPPANILSSPLTTESEPQFAITSSSLRRSSRESRKRQRASQQTSTVPEQEPAPPIVATPTPTPTARKHTPRALKPVHVKEAVRRLSQPHLLTPVTPLWSHQPTAASRKSQKSWCL